MTDRWGVFRLDDDRMVAGPFASEREAESELLQQPSHGDMYDYGYEYTTRVIDEPRAVTPLNLTPGDGRMCSLHPQHPVGPDGCGMCWSVHMDCS